MKSDKLYIALVALVFAAFAIVFDTFPRSKVSELEKRELAKFPQFTTSKLWDGSFMKDVSAWFSDSEPYRDHLMAFSMELKNAMRISTGDESVTFHASNSTQTETSSTDNDNDGGDRVVGDYENNITADENAKIANAGIVVVGSGDKVRALMAFGGSSRGCVAYARAANKYKEVLGNGVNVYCMVIPTAIEYYCPEKARSITRPQRPCINATYALLAPNVKAVDAYTILGQHADEDIFLRTDHHWAPLGAYYAAKSFAAVANVPFRDLASYDRKVVHRYVGSMYGYSNDIAIKNAPEDFVYYVPRDVTYSTTYINYTIDENYKVIGEAKPVKGAFFAHFRDGSGAAYCTFMGGDTKITQVRTSTKNGRRVLILKDSFGNAIPGYLFYSFEEIHVVDSRYFTKNMRSYIADNHITDVLFANNIFKAYSPHIYNIYARFLDQATYTPHPSPKVVNDTLHAPTHNKHSKVLSDTTTTPKPTTPTVPATEETEEIRMRE